MPVFRDSPIDLLLALYAGDVEVLVDSWEQGDSFRRAVYRKMPDIAQFYGGKVLHITQSKKNGYVKLTAHLTNKIRGDTIGAGDISL